MYAHAHALNFKMSWAHNSFWMYLNAQQQKIIKMISNPNPSPSTVNLIIELIMWQYPTPLLKVLSLVWNRRQRLSEIRQYDKLRTYVLFIVWSGQSTNPGLAFYFLLLYHHITQKSKSVSKSEPQSFHCCDERLRTSDTNFSWKGKNIRGLKFKLKEFGRVWKCTHPYFRCQPIQQMDMCLASTLNWYCRNCK